MKLEELVGKPITEAQFDEAAGKKDACYHKVTARYDVWPSAYASGALVKCRKVGAANWGNKSKKKEGMNEAFAIQYKKDKRYLTRKELFDKKPLKFKTEDEAKSMLNGLDHQYRTNYKIVKIKEGLGDRISKISKRYAKGQKKSKKALKNKKGPYQEDVFYESTTKDGMTETHIYWESDGKHHGYTFNFVNELNEAEYQGRKVKLGKVMQGDAKKFKVYVKNPKGNVVKVNFGQGGKAKGGTMRIRKSNPKARANFRARHNCDNPGPRHKARYWSCRKW